MDYQTFQNSLKENNPPDQISQALQALWWDAKDNWDKAHQAAQDVSGTDGSWVHAYLHRKDGDEFNAGYWYSRAGRTASKLSLENEWEEIVNELLT